MTLNEWQNNEISFTATASSKGYFGCGSRVLYNLVGAVGMFHQCYECASQVLYIIYIGCVVTVQLICLAGSSLIKFSCT